MKGVQDLSILENVKPTVARVANAIGTVLGADVVIADNQGQFIATSEGYLERKGSGPYRPFLQHVIAAGEHIVIERPGAHPLCAGCLSEGDCPQVCEVITPFSYKGNVIGYISLVTFSLGKKQEFLQKQQEIIAFLEQMGEMIVHTVAETDTRHELSCALNQLSITMDAVSYGLITCNADGQITQSNKGAQTLLGYSQAKMIGESIAKLMPRCTAVDAILEEKQCFIEKEWLTEVGNRSYHMIVSGHRIENESGGLQGAVFVLQGMEQVHRFIYNISSQDVEFTTKDIIGNSAATEKLRHQIATIAPSNSTVLIRGESGTGKELVARAIHALSPRSDKPFVAINCGAIPDTLLESELFGYEEGAFTGAKRGGKVGKFELANGGTIFLDEIGDTPLHLQVKLLRVLQEKAVERVGGSHPIPLNIRVVAATNRDLESMIASNQFREDLYWRLSVIPIVVPPLRERPEDILSLCTFFISKFNRALEAHVQGMSAGFQKIMLSYNWPGNIRELENAIEYAVNVEKSELLTVASLPPLIQDWMDAQESKAGFKLDAHIQLLERDLIKRALKRYGTSQEGKLKAAQALGVSRATFYRKAKRAGLID